MVTNVWTALGDYRKKKSSDTKISSSYTKLVVGDGYAAYIDETSNLHNFV